MRILELSSLVGKRALTIPEKSSLLWSMLPLSSRSVLSGATAIVGLARLSARSVGIISINCQINAGALDAAGSQKITRHLKFCDVFNIPIVQFVDVPEYAIGTIAKRTATMRWGVELAKSYYSTSVNVFSMVTRRVYGVAGGIMLDCREPRMRVVSLTRTFLIILGVKRMLAYVLLYSLFISLLISKFILRLP